MQIPFLISEKKIRPPVPDHIPTYLSDIMTKCWAEDPLKRPAFSDIINYFNQAAMHIDMNAVVKPVTRKHFGHGVCIPETDVLIPTGYDEALTNSMKNIVPTGGGDEALTASTQKVSQVRPEDPPP
jgi:hypothetical protein